MYTETTPTVKRLSPPVVFLTPPEKLVLEFSSYGNFEYLVWHRDRRALASDNLAHNSEFTHFLEVYAREPTTNIDFGEYYAAIDNTGRSIEDSIFVSERSE